mgnify:CR=1 FL=1
MSAIEHAAAAYRAATDEFLSAARELSDEQLDRKHPEGWSARQIIHHVADVSAIAYGRLVFLVGLSAPVIVAFDEAQLAASPELGYNEVPVEGSLALFETSRARAASIIDRLTVADLERTGRHTERGDLKIAQWIDMDTRHATEHAQQLRHAVHGEL